jgi:hypothetical protein
MKCRWIPDSDCTSCGIGIDCDYPASAEPEEVDAFHYHEALDRSHVILCNMSDHLEGHPVFLKHPELNAKLDAAMKNMMDLYQSIGAIEYDPKEK